MTDFEKKVKEQEMENVRRSWWSYMSYLIFLLLSLSKLFLTQTSFTYPWYFIGLISLTVLIRLILTPYYFEVRGTRLTINRDLFYKDQVEIADMEKIELEEGPFSTSYVRLKDNGKGLRFNYFIVNDQDFNQFRDALQLKVE